MDGEKPNLLVGCPSLPASPLIVAATLFDADWMLFVLIPPLVATSSRQLKPGGHPVRPLRRLMVIYWCIWSAVNGIIFPNPEQASVGDRDCF